MQYLMPEERGITTWMSKPTVESQRDVDILHSFTRKHGWSASRLLDRANDLYERIAQSSESVFDIGQ